MCYAEIRAQLEVLIQNIQLFIDGELANVKEAITQAELIGEVLAEEFEKEEQALPKPGK